jgi:YD repeat-containing protein
MIHRFLPAILIALTCTSALSAAERWRGRYSSGRASVPTRGYQQYYVEPQTYVEYSSQARRGPVYYDGVRQYQGRTSTFRDTTQSFGRTGTYGPRTPGFRESGRYYGGPGGYTETQGNVTLYYDSRGRLIGESEALDGMTRYYNPNGRYTGRTR